MPYQQLTLLGWLVLCGWVPFVLVLFAMLPPRRAAVISFMMGWLFLPETTIPFQGFPEYGKVTATSFSVLLGILIFDTSRFFSFKPRWFDLPVIVWCFSPFFTSLANGFGAYDGASAVLDQILLWGVPYFIGRLYINNQQAVHELALAVFISGLIYMPLCWYEMRMSPQLHSIFYGGHATGFGNTWRLGGWRPVVFMHGGLALTLWMASATLCGFTVWRSGRLQQLMGVPIAWWLGLLFITTILCRSTGALLLMVAAIGLYFSYTMLRTRALLILAVMAVPVYLCLRIGVGWDGQEAVDLASYLVNEGRAASLETRLSNEQMLVEGRSSLIGYGGWGNARLQDETGRDIVITDSLWIIAFTQYGYVGMITVYTLMLLPLALFIHRVPPSMMDRRLLAPVLGLLLAMWMFGMDMLLNAQPNPLFVLIIGGVLGAPWMPRLAAQSHQEAHSVGRTRGRTPQLSSANARGGGL